MFFDFDFKTYTKLSSRLNGPILLARSFGNDTLCFLKLFKYVLDDRLTCIIS
jgi:hypothetical protein